MGRCPSGQKNPHNLSLAAPSRTNQRSPASSATAVWIKPRVESCIDKRDISGNSCVNEMSNVVTAMFRTQCKKLLLCGNRVRYSALLPREAVSLLKYAAKS